MRYGWVSGNIVDLWTRPKFNSERASQLLFGQAVQILKERTGHYYVSLPDKYSGWVDCRFVEIITRKACKQHLSAVNSFVKASTANIYCRKSKSGTAPHQLYYGSRLFTRSTNGGFARIVLPGKSGLLIKKNTLVPINRTNVRAITGKMLVTEASRFLGVPYLWGGVTSAGFDCSGLVQTVLMRFGINIPRDTKDQIHVGERIDRDCIKTGDLLFLKRHVGFAVGKDRIIHSSVGGGGVRINSLMPNGADYREDLDRDFNQARRILCSN